MASNSNEPSQDRLLKILCIHGYRQNDKTFRERTGAFRKITKKLADLVFISAPNIVPPIQQENDTAQEQTYDQRGWWFSRQDDYFTAKERSDCCKGYAESLTVIEEAFKTQGPFDGVLGFSQGASMVSLLCGLLQQKDACSFQFKFAILVAGFKSKSSQHDRLYSESISIPTLHVFGDTDQVIEKEMSEDLLQHFSEPVVLNHPGGHFIPASSAQKKTYVDFLNAMKT